MSAIKLMQMVLVALAACAATAAAPSVAAAEARHACPSVPLLVVGQGFENPRGRFSAGSAALSRLRALFAAAFRRACAQGNLEGWPILAAKARYGDRVFLENSPHESGAWIALSGAEAAPAARRLIVLGFPFVSAAGRVRLPSAQQLDEALICGVVHHAQPNVDILMCLPS